MAKRNTKTEAATDERKAKAQKARKAEKERERRAAKKAEAIYGEGAEGELTTTIENITASAPAFATTGGPGDRYLTSHQVAHLIHCNASSVNDWAKSGRIHAYTTPGGHRRFSLNAVIEFVRLNNMPPIDLSRLPQDKQAA